MKRAKVAILIAAFCGPLGCDQQGDLSVGSDTESSQNELFVDPGKTVTATVQTVCFDPGGGPIKWFADYNNQINPKCLTADTSNLTRVFVADCTDPVSDAQNWSIAGDGTVRALGRCLDVTGGGVDNGTVVGLFYCNGTGAQQWEPIEAGYNLGYLMNPQSTRYLDLWRADPTNGGDLKLWNPAPVVDGHPAFGYQRAEMWQLPYAEVPPELQHQVRDALANSWQAVTAITFENWGSCASLPATRDNTTEIFYQKRAWIRNGTSDLTGTRHRKMVSNLWDEESARGNVVHEFGHVLGFEHEQGRPENEPNNPYPDGPYCQAFQTHSGHTGWEEEASHSTGVAAGGIFDPESVDNYCQWPKQTWMLSRNDILGSQTSSKANYGSRDYSGSGEYRYRKVVWSSGTARSTNHKPSSGSDTLSVGAKWSSPDGVVALTLLADGHLAVIRTDLPPKDSSGSLLNPDLTAFAPLWLSVLRDGANSVSNPVASFGTDGILRIVDGSKKTWWQSTTTSYNGATLSIQRDGDVVITTTSGSPPKTTTRWHTDTAHRSEMDGAAGLIPGQVLAVGQQSLITKSKAFELKMQTDHSLVLYQKGTKIWSKTASTAMGARMMQDGRFCLVDVLFGALGQCLIEISSTKAPGTFLALQEDGNLVVYEPGKYAIWKAGGLQKQWGWGQVIEPLQYGYPADEVMMLNGGKLNRGNTVYTRSGKAQLTLQASDGNLVVYVNKGTPTSPNWSATWSSWNACNGGGCVGVGDVATLTDGGALQVSTSAGSVTYDSNTSGYRNTYLALTDDGVLSIYRIVTVGSGDWRGFTY